MLRGTEEFWSLRSGEVRRIAMLSDSLNRWESVTEIIEKFEGKMSCPVSEKWRYILLLGIFWRILPVRDDSPLCSAMRVLKWRIVSPIYVAEHSLHE